MARHEKAIYVKAVGLANMRIAPTLDAFQDQAVDGVIKLLLI